MEVFKPDTIKEENITCGRNNKQSQLKLCFKSFTCFIHEDTFAMVKRKHERHTGDYSSKTMQYSLVEKR